MKFLIFILVSSCAIKHHVQVGDIAPMDSEKSKPFEVLLSETGVNLEQASDLITAATKDGGRAQEVQNIISMFQVGPRTGNPVFNEKYADVLPELILKECPSGKVTGLLMIRETNSYPVVSGEIVKVRGYCLQ
ncbi:MAG: hypothetical protein CME62_11910 [Halobacteriovoraceae bacterium]|nr:hypothetical protein [Halobacteriovoraceae bacterium]|tara:strand:+ start:14207 stop:14605 length:399 start_codon:yes stop_codon:yes gene_type:complete